MNGKGISENRLNFPHISVSVFWRMSYFPTLIFYTFPGFLWHVYAMGYAGFQDNVESQTNSDGAKISWVYILIQVILEET